MTSLISNILLISTLFINISMGMKLELINAIFRHGDRTPLKFQNELISHTNITFLSGESGILTDSGIKRSAVLGKHLRQLYGNFLDNFSINKQISAYSTTSPRTLRTLEAVLKELYHSKNDKNDTLRSSPIEIISLDRNFLFINCKTYVDKVKEIRLSQKIEEKIKQFTNLMKKISEFVENEINGLGKLFEVGDKLITEYYMNLRLPPGAYDIINDSELYDAQSLFYDIYSYTEYMRRFNGGKILKYFIDEIRNKINGTNSNTKINLIAAHDFNIAALVRTLQLFRKNVPAFTSGVFLELLSHNNLYYVKMKYYEGIPSGVSTEIKVPGCADPCSFDEFLNLYKNVITTDEDEKCESVPFRGVDLFSFNGVDTI